ncbi:ABC transporter ATP-binding protein [Rhizobium sp. RAF56]|jgi:ABC-type nitrate/sulfonate/bicarbonate transport system ATPase subunit|uniref:ABC transporter ATP-binding protein n=1 Tax=Rhizobium sp. RAF56 TaxID=3233062 RepID=UPI003F9D526D
MSARRLELLDIRKSFGSVPVLDGISLYEEEGEFVTIVGPSGAGKSTILRMLTGADTADSGEIRFADQPLATSGATFAFMPQRDALMPWRCILDNATLGLEVAGLDRDTARARVLPHFETFGLAGFERHYPAQLSGGMRQRAALLRTVVQARDMLLFDEPFGALDAITRAQMQQWLSQMWTGHRWTALLITHDVREAVFLSDRIYVLSPRPARIAASFTVPLPRPRSFADLGSAEARTIETAILETLLHANS